MVGIIDFENVFGISSDRDKLIDMPQEARLGEILLLVDKMNDEYSPYNLSHQEASDLVNKAYAKFIAQHAPDREFTPLELATPPLDVRILYPYYLGFYSGNKPSVMTKEGDLKTPSTIGHEFAHVLGHYSEIEAEVLGYLTLKESDERLLQRSADMTRISRQSWATGITDLLDTNLRDEIKDEIRFSRKMTPYQNMMMHLTFHIGKFLFLKRQGLESTDYREGFTNFLYSAGIEID